MMHRRVLLAVSLVAVAAVLSGCIASASAFETSLTPLATSTAPSQRFEPVATTSTASTPATSPATTASRDASAAARLGSLCARAEKRATPLPTPSRGSGARGSAGMSEAERIRRAKAAKKAAWEAAEEQWRKNKAELDAWRASQGDDY